MNSAFEVGCEARLWGVLQERNLGEPVSLPHLSIRNGYPMLAAPPSCLRKQQSERQEGMKGVRERSAYLVLICLLTRLSEASSRWRVEHWMDQGRVEDKERRQGRKTKTAHYPGGGDGQVPGGRGSLRCTVSDYFPSSPTLSW